MHIHILSICGKFMSGLALIAKELGYTVTGSDQKLVEPIYSELTAQGIQILQGYEPEPILQLKPDGFIIGNALSRGHEIVETILNQRLPFYSGPQWLANNVLQQRWVLAVSGTHGKTTTSSMLTWIMDYAGLNPSYLIGGQPNNFKNCARLSDSPFFVIEADEYDTAFFDKRPKFMHYCPSTLIINNIEYDHADIFPDLAVIQQQFHYLVRLVPQHGSIIVPSEDSAIKTVLQKGCWTPIQMIGNQNSFHARNISDDASCFDVFFEKKNIGRIQWNLLGQHNINNALAAVAAAQHAGVSPEHAIEALNTFQGVQRRLELKGVARGIKVYDDFAHHPTAIATTIEGLRAHIGKQTRLFAVLQFGSHTMRSGIHQKAILESFKKADHILFLKPSNDTWGIDKVIEESSGHAKLYDTVEDIICDLSEQCREGDHVLIMSNLEFENIHQRFLQRLQTPTL